MFRPTKPKTTHLSPEAHQTFSLELEKLKKELGAVMERLKIAREMGDLSENGAYKYAKFELGDIRRRMRELTHILENSTVINKKATYTLVELGCLVTTSDGKTNDTWEVVGQYEADPLNQKISIESPFGSALKGKKTGDTVTVHTPAGSTEYTITHIQ